MGDVIVPKFGGGSGGGGGGGGGRAGSGVGSGWVGCVCQGAGVCVCQGAGVCEKGGGTHPTRLARITSPMAWAFSTILSSLSAVSDACARAAVIIIIYIYNCLFII